MRFSLAFLTFLGVVSAQSFSGELNGVIFSFFEENSRTFDEAKAECEKLDLDFGRVENKEQFNFLTELAKENLRVSFWVGLKTDETEEQNVLNPASYKFVSGPPNGAGFFSQRGESPWDENEPSFSDVDDDIEQCVEARVEKDFAWNNQVCNRRRPFLCSTSTGQAEDSSEVSGVFMVMFVILVGFLVAMIVALKLERKKVAKLLSTQILMSFPSQP